MISFERKLGILKSQLIFRAEVKRLAKENMAEKNYEQFLEEIEALDDGIYELVSIDIPWLASLNLEETFDNLTYDLANIKTYNDVINWFEEKDVKAKDYCFEQIKCIMKADHCIRQEDVYQEGKDNYIYTFELLNDGVCDIYENLKVEIQEKCETHELTEEDDEYLFDIFCEYGYECMKNSETVEQFIKNIASKFDEKAEVK